MSFPNFFRRFWKVAWEASHAFHLRVFPSHACRKRAFWPQAPPPQCSKRESDGNRDVCFSGSTLPSENFIYSINLIKGLLCGRLCFRHQRDNCEYEKSLITELPTQEHRVKMEPQQESDKEELKEPKKEGLTTNVYGEPAQPDRSPKGNGSRMLAPFPGLWVILWSAVNKGSFGW